jgi:hypothetical protein
MRPSRLLSAIAVAAAIGASSPARAETTPLAAVRESVETVELRERAILARAERSNEEVRRESERVVSAVAKRRRALSARLDLLEILGRDGTVDEGVIVEMRATLDRSNRLLDLVEKWLGMR